MSVRRFLLPVSSSASAEAALHAGLMLAKMWSAHLMVLHIRIDSRDIAPLAGEGLSGSMIEEMMTATEKESGSRALGLRDLFNLATEEQHVTVGNAVRGRNEPSASFTVVEGREDEIIAHQARLADLTIVPHPQAGEDVASADALHAVLFDSGRPGADGAGRPTRQHRQARRHRLERHLGSGLGPGLHHAVHPPGGSGAHPHLGRIPPPRRPHRRRSAGLRRRPRRGPATSSNFPSINRVVGAGLLAAAAEFGADLMSMGAYSTSRLRQLILGGTTRHVLENATLPVLLNR